MKKNTSGHKGCKAGSGLSSIHHPLTLHWIGQRTSSKATAHHGGWCTLSAPARTPCGPRVPCRAAVESACPAGGSCHKPARSLGQGSVGGRFQCLAHLSAAAACPEVMTGDARGGCARLWVVPAWLASRDDLAQIGNRGSDVPVARGIGWPQSGPLSRRRRRPAPSAPLSEAASPEARPQRPLQPAAAVLARARMAAAASARAKPALAWLRQRRRQRPRGRVPD